MKGRLRAMRLSRVALAAAACWPSVTVAQVPGRPAALGRVDIEQRLGEQIPLDVAFHDESGKSVELASYFGQKPVILSLVYYECPMLCTLTLNGLLRTLRTLSFTAGDEFRVITVSFNPNEGPELAAAKKANYLAQYARAGGEQGWHFLTGDEESIRKLTAAVGYKYDWDPETKQYAHASAIIILTPQGKIARYFYGIEFAPNDVRLGLIEAASERIANPVDKILLYCYRYDPATGRYGLAVTNILRIGGVLTVVAIGLFVLRMLRRHG